jgi:hypothetical protein
MGASGVCDKWSKRKRDEGLGDKPIDKANAIDRMTEQDKTGIFMSGHCPQISKISKLQQSLANEVAASVKRSV